MPESSARELLESNKRLTEALKELSGRLDRLPDTIDRTYVRKDVAQEHDRRVEVVLADLTKGLAEERAARIQSYVDEKLERDALAKRLEDALDKLDLRFRWLITSVVIPTALAIVGIVLSSHGGSV